MKMQLVPQTEGNQVNTKMFTSTMNARSYFPSQISKKPEQSHSTDIIMSRFFLHDAHFREAVPYKTHGYNVSLNAHTMLVFRPKEIRSQLDCI